MIKAYGFSLSKDDYNMINNMVGLLESQPPLIFDLRSYTPDTDPNDIVLLFGPQAQRRCADIPGNKFVLPDLKSLHRDKGDPAARQKAYEELMVIKDWIQIQIDPEDDLRNLFLGIV